MERWGSGNIMAILVRSYTLVNSNVSSQQGVDWIAVTTFTNSWLNFASGNPIASYYKDSLGIVHLQGVIKSGTSGTSAFTLPAGYRPLLNQILTSTANGAFGTLEVGPDGTVKPNGSNVYISLNGITFKAEQ